jgi:peptidyl-dipeptidase Dcp
MSNPLMLPLTQPLWAPRFDQFKAEHYLPAVQECAAQIRATLASIVSDTAAATFANTILRMNRSFDQFRFVASTYFNALHATSTEDLQKLAGEISKISADLSSDVNLNAELFARIQTVFKEAKASSVTGEDWVLIEKTFREFKRNGALLTEAQKDELRKIDQQLATLAPIYSENLLKATQAFNLELTLESDLEGLSDRLRNAAKEKALQAGKTGYLFGLDAPTYIEFMTHGKNRAAREKLWRAYGGRCYHDAFDNSNHVKTIVELRQKRAKLLGYSSHAQYQLEERMAESPLRVQTFLEKLRIVALPAAQNEIKKLGEVQNVLIGTSEVRPWDLMFLSERLKEQTFQVSEEEVRQFLPLEGVLSGLFNLLKKLYSIEFRESSTVQTYADLVKAYEVWDANKNERLGLLYCDFFARPTKSPGAWCCSWLEQGSYQTDSARPVIGVVTNFAPPAAGSATLLSFNDATTLFHEFGHALHHLLSQCDYSEISGTNVFWDFVELPSQFMENWLNEPEVLKDLAKHHATGATMSDELIEKINLSSQFMAGYHCIRQVNFAMLDMHWHHDADLTKPLETIEDEATKATRLLPAVEGVNTSCSFSHVFAGGYSAGYYSYKWAEVLDADAFQFFKDKGLFDGNIAHNFRTHILERGGTDHPMTLYKKFRGREPEVDALLKRDGLIS